jgi:hypothetical protein
MEIEREMEVEREMEKKIRIKYGNNNSVSIFNKEKLNDISLLFKEVEDDEEEFNDFTFTEPFANDITMKLFKEYYDYQTDSGNITIKLKDLNCPVESTDFREEVKEYNGFYYQLLKNADDANELRNLFIFADFIQSELLCHLIVVYVACQIKGTKKSEMGRFSQYFL